jgi:hypothetical protein
MDASPFAIGIEAFSPRFALDEIELNARFQPIANGCATMLEKSFFKTIQSIQWARF